MVKELMWFNASLMYSALAAGFAVNTTYPPARFMLVFLAVHGGLWAIYRAMVLVARGVISGLPK